MPLDHPSGMEAKPGKDHVGRLEGAIPAVQRGPNAIESKTNDIRPAIAGEICNKSGLFRTPALTTPTHSCVSLMREVAHSFT